MLNKIQILTYNIYNNGILSDAPTQVDNRMRAWYIKNMSVGLLYQCSLGDLRLDSPVALLQNRRQDGLDFTEVVPMEHQLPAQRDQVPT